MITTKSVGIGEEAANPKPVRHINWCGQPMKEGDNYWGESKPQASQAEVAQSVTPVRPRKAKRNSAWTPERRAEYSAKVKAWWQAKKQQSTTEGT